MNPRHHPWGDRSLKHAAGQLPAGRAWRIRGWPASDVWMGKIFSPMVRTR
jgi:hypothetical protein